LKLKEGLEWEGIITFKVIDEKTKEIKRQYKEHNKVTNYARGYMAQILTNAVNGSLVLPSMIELGTGTGTPLATDADLWSPATVTLVSCTGIQVYLNYYAQFITTWQPNTITGTYTEVGLKDANGNLWAHAAITSNLTVNSGEQLVCQWQIQFTSS
jgi:hypothetical protein